MAFMSRFIAAAAAVATASLDVDDVRGSDWDEPKPACRRSSTEDLRMFEAAVRIDWHPLYAENDAARSGITMLSNYIHRQIPVVTRWIHCATVNVSATVLSCMHARCNINFLLYTVCQKTVQNCFCQNFVKCPPILIIFGRKMVKGLKLCKVYSFSTSSNLRHHTTVLNADVLNCYTTL